MQAYPRIFSCPQNLFPKPGAAYPHSLRPLSRRQAECLEDAMAVRSVSCPAMSCSTMAHNRDWRGLQRTGGCQADVWNGGQRAAGDQAVGRALPMLKESYAKGPLATGVGKSCRSGLLSRQKYTTKTPCGARFCHVPY